MQLTPIAPFPCGICGASPRRREHLRDGFELCTECKFAIRLDARGDLIAWATTNVSHPRPDRRGWLRRAASVVLLALITGCAPRTAVPSTIPARDVTAGVVQLVSSRALGQGCPIAETLLLTAAHLALTLRSIGPPDAVQATWSDADGANGAVRTIAYDERRDLALMQSDRAFARWYARPDAAPAIGDPVLIVGYDYRDRLHRQVVRAEIVNLIATHLVLSQAGQPGFSGSCVVDRAGRVVGIFVAAVGLDAARYGLAIGVWGEWMPWVSGTSAADE